MCFAYNCDLYYREYFPDYDLGWWLFSVTIVIGSIGVVAGGIISDKFVAKMGIKSRVAVLAISQLIASPGAFGSVYFEPVGAMITLGLSYFFGKRQMIAPPPKKNYYKIHVSCSGDVVRHCLCRLSRGRPAINEIHNSRSVSLRDEQYRW